MSGGFHTIGDWVETGVDVAVTLARDSHGRVLIQLRDDFSHVVKAGWWCLFGGHVEQDEALIDAAAREFAEETGLDFPQNSFAPFVRLISDNGRRHFVYRLEVPVAGEQISLREGAGFAFVNAGQLEQLRILPAARLALDHHFATATR
ncbi:MAG: NUDIX hydrolase [Rhodobacteraceae bacterium]|nr:NUDIX hydrolase [Paracoccaceae bacterium]